MLLVEYLYILMYKYSYAQGDVATPAFCASGVRGEVMKQQRHMAIRDLLSRTAVTSQDDLRRRLAAKGFHVTQATLSRDIHELRLSKGPGGYFLPGKGEEEESSSPGIREVLHSFGLEVRQ